ncbi:c-type cytochrome [Rhodanobacter lindaniclasticus]
MLHTQAISATDKPTLYAELAQQARGLFVGERNLIANAANFSALIYHALPQLNWAGFYLFDGTELVVGPFQGKPACIRIALGRGVCGTAAQQRQTQLVRDVSTHPNHIYCDAASQSEIVVPLIHADGSPPLPRPPHLPPIYHALSVQDMHDLGAYFASQTSRPGVADQALVEPGETLFRQGDATRDIPACMACHSIDGRGNPGAMYPQLAGQHAQYIEATLKAWHDGASWGTDAHSQIMPTIATKLDAKDIAALASYIEGLHAVEGTPAAAATP